MTRPTWFENPEVAFSDEAEGEEYSAFEENIRKDINLRIENGQMTTTEGDTEISARLKQVN